MAASADTPVLDLLTTMTAESVVVSSLDPQSLMVARIAALVATDAPAISYVLNLEAAVETGIDAMQVRGILTAIAPIVGTVRVASALGKIADALEVELEIAELQAQSQE
jgi:4-carboxymuconolactone decarboxylase